MLSGSGNSSSCPERVLTEQHTLEKENLTVAFNSTKLQSSLKVKVRMKQDCESHCQGLFSYHTEQGVQEENILTAINWSQVRSWFKCSICFFHPSHRQSKRATLLLQCLPLLTHVSAPSQRNCTVNGNPPECLRAFSKQSHKILLCYISNTLKILLIGERARNNS